MSFLPCALSGILLPLVLLLACHEPLPVGNDPKPRQSEIAKLTTKQLLNELKAFPQDDRWGISHYYDMHGNADERLQILMVRRFAATKEICAEIDANSAKSHPAYVAALYHVLATVKDPASIKWLEKTMDGPRRADLSAHWLARWITWQWGAGPSELKWLPEPSRWSYFFQKWAATETNRTNRLAVLHAMQGWLHDRQTQDYFLALDRDAKSFGEELLLTHLYLRQHGERPDETKLKPTIVGLQTTESGERILLRYADAIRHEAFVPWLITVADKEVEEDFATPQRALERITFQRGVSGRVAWLRWQEANGNASRAEWTDRAAYQLIALAHTNVTAAGLHMAESIYTWDDLRMLPHMLKLSEFKPLHSEIVGWINLSYTEVPFLRSKLRPLAEKIRRESGGELKDWAKRLMDSWDFFSEDTTTWEQYVRMQNLRV